MFLLSTLFVCFSAFGSHFEVPSENVLASHKLGDVKLYHTYEGFKVHSGDKYHDVQKAWMDPMLRKMNAKQLQAFLGKGYISINKLDNDEYVLKAKVRGLGGGPIGATVGTVAGAALVQGAWHGALGGLGVVLSPFISPVGAAAVVGTVRFFGAGPVLVATKTAAMAGGIAGAVLTGPI